MPAALLALAGAAAAQPVHEDGFAAWSPDGLAVAYASSESGRFQIYVARDGVRRRVTDSSGNDISPEWSPDGASLIFVSDRDGNMELYAVRLADGTETRLTDTPGSEMAPDWGPDGWIAFAYSPSTDPRRLGATSRVFVSRLDGSQRAAILDAGVQHYPKWSPEGERITFSGSVDDTPGYRVWVTDRRSAPVLVSGGRTGFNSDWMPDGSAVVFVSPEDGVATIYRAPADGRGPERLTYNAEPWFEPRVSPDGSRIAVRVGNGPDNRGIGVLDGQGVFREMLAREDAPADDAGDASAAAALVYAAPSWNPDGRALVYVEQGADRQRIWRMAPDGTDRAPVSPVEATDRNPAYSPDGTRIAFVSEADGTPQLWVMDADGGARARLTQLDRGATQPRWTRDGGWIVFTTGAQNGVGILYRVRPDGTGLERLGDPAWSEIYPVPSPTDDRMITAGKEVGARYFRILLRAGVGRPPTTLVARDAPCYNPDWSPDGEWVAFVSHVGEDLSQTAIFVVRADGTGLRQLTDFPEGSYQPRWSPDGSSIVIRRGWTNHRGLYRVALDGSEVVRLVGA